MASHYIKQGSTYYTPEKVNAARENIRQYEWAKEMALNAEKRADLYLSVGEDGLWRMVTSQNLPRSFAVNQELGCPVCKTNIHAYGRWPYLADVKINPWKIECPSCHSLFPSNDFGAYYKSGLDERGEFQPGITDRSLLVNTGYPGQDATLYVDDGYGWIDKDGNRYTFIAFYNHWKLWINMIDAGGNKFPEGYPLGHGGIIHNALDSFKDAYLYTGKPEYARAGIIMLDRIADIFPCMDSSAYKWEDGFRNSHGGSGKGKITGNIWDTGLCKTFAQAYDAFFPAMEDSYILDFLSQKANEYPLLNSKSSPADIRRNIEKNLLQEIFKGVKNCQVRGNNGSHQSALAMAAVVADDPLTTPVMLDFIFQTQEEFNHDQLTGGNLSKSLIDDIDRDGFGNEASPSYNNIWVQTFAQIADILKDYDRYPKGDLYQHPKFIKMSEAHYHLMMCDRYTVTIGDSSSVGNPHLFGNMTTAINSYEKTKEPLFAHMAWLLSGKDIDKLHAGIFSHDPENIKKVVQNFLTTGTFNNPKSDHLSGYGFTALRDGTGENQRDIWMYMGRNTGHGHKDTLYLGMHAFGVDMAPDLGYPEQCDSVYQKTHHFDKHTVCHNTVMVDESNQKANLVGESIYFDNKKPVQFMDAAAPSAYPQTTLYRRCAALIRIDEIDSYVFDMFYVKGGNQHHYIFHAAEGQAIVRGAEIKKQETGTYAGKTIEYGCAYDAKPKERLTSYSGSGFHYLKNVERATDPKMPVCIDWSVKDTWNVGPKDTQRHLCMTLLEDVEEIALADGIPSQNRPGNPKSLRYVLAKRQGSKIESLFAAVIEPYRINKRIKSIEKLKMVCDDQNVHEKDQVAVMITMDTGITHIIIHSLHPDISYTVGDSIRFQGAFGFIIRENERVQYSYLCEGTRLSIGETVLMEEQPSVTGHIVDFTHELSMDNHINVRLDDSLCYSVPLTDQLLGKIIRIDNKTDRNPVYEIIKAERQSSDTYRLSIGNISLIRNLKDRYDLDKGYEYDIKEGDPFIIPLSVERYFEE